MDIALFVLTLLSIGVLRGSDAFRVDRKERGNPCAGDDDCLGRGLACREGSCECEKDWSWSLGFCHKQRTRCVDNPESCDASKGLDCSYGYCSCKELEQSFSPRKGSCGLGVLQPCVENGVLRHDLCASGLCVGEDTNQLALAGKCSCAEETAVKQILTVHGICTEDPFGHPCNPPDEEKLCATFFMEKALGLSCREVDNKWICACPIFYSYFAGFCVQATRSHGEECDPRGVEPTCSVDSAVGLVCDDDGRGTFLCRCGKKALTFADGRVEYGSMTWNDDAQRCELVPRNSGGGVVRRRLAILTASVYLIILKS